MSRWGDVNGGLRVGGRRTVSFRNKFVAVVVTYFPEVEVTAGNLAAIRREVDAVLVVDNGSPPDDQEYVISSIDPGIAGIWLGQNAGSARAQNIGAAWARCRRRSGRRC